MKNTVLKYGIYSFILASILFSSALYFGYALAFKTHGIIGYATIVASLVFVLVLELPLFPQLLLV